MTIAEMKALQMIKQIRRCMCHGMLSLLMIVPLFSQAATELPDIGDPSDNLMSPTSARQLGEGLMRMLRHNDMLLSDPILQEYITNLGYKLSTASDKPGDQYVFFIVKDNSVNAFAAPGGFIGIHSGLIKIAESESELASVISHEIAHITQNHLFRAYDATSKQRLSTAILMLAAILLGGGDSEVTTAAVASGIAAGVQTSINFTRQNEKEADRLGIEILASTGYNPNSMADFFQRMHNATRLYGSQAPEFLRTHPVTSTRVADAKNRAALMQVTPSYNDEYFQLMRARVIVLSEDDPQLPLKIFKAKLDSEHKLTREAAEYGYILALIRARQADEALTRLRIKTKNNPDSILYQLAMAEALELNGQVKTSLKLYKKIQTNSPDNRAVTMYHASALIRNNQPEAARKLLRALLDKYKDDSQLHQIYARASEKSSNIGDAYFHLAEYYYLNGSTETAIDHLTRARKLPEMDYYLRARIDARLKQYQAMLELEKE